MKANVVQPRLLPAVATHCLLVEYFYFFIFVNEMIVERFCCTSGQCKNSKVDNDAEQWQTCLVSLKQDRRPAFHP